VAKVFVPTMLQAATGGVKEVEVEARNVRQVIERLDELFPGIGDRLIEDGDIRSNLAVAVDGEVARMGLLERVREDTEVHFVPAIGGGG
jgi:molybdopterin synthase sulfur carrier subunit